MVTTYEVAKTDKNKYSKLEKKNHTSADTVFWTAILQYSLQNVTPFFSSTSLPWSIKCTRVFTDCMAQIGYNLNAHEWKNGYSTSILKNTR